MNWVELLGWAGVALTLATYSQKTMIPLRVSAICANLAFISWSLSAEIMQTLALHATLLPFNVYRLSEIFWMRRRADRALAGGASTLDWLRPIMRPRVYEPGEYIFRHGDPVDHLYYLTSGEIEFVEHDAVLTEGGIFGEVAFFTRAGARTSSALCKTRCEVMAVDGHDFVTICSQNPDFSVHICKIIANRLIEDARIAGATPRGTDGAQTDPAEHDPARPALA